MGSGQGVTVAIIDTGIDLDHPDLQNNINPDKSVTCIEKSPVKQVKCVTGGDDDNGHGSHVAGTVAAIDNSIGVVGVAPEAELWAIKVLDSQGSGRISWIVAGIDYVTANNADVANMSLGCECQNTALDDAISNSVASGVTYVVAAGNSGKDASSFSPANHPDVITVSAIADSDGTCGSQGGSTSYGEDDTFASFSNDGALIEIAAPGVDIYSTYKDGSYYTASGTSMASPHVAGAAALLIDSDSTLEPDQVRSALINNGVSQDTICKSNTGYGGFDGDIDGYSEPLVYVGNTSVGDSPVVSITSPADGASFDSGASITFEGSASDTEDGDLTSNLSWTSDIDGAIGTGGSFTTTLSDGSHTITASVTDTDGNSASDSVSITVVNNPPSVSITSPADGASFDSGASVTFEGTASDTEDGDLTSDLSWTSDIDGAIGTGGSFTTTLSDGSHTITASVTDSDGKSGESTISITIGNAPTVSASIDYVPFGGKNDNKHLDVVIHLTDGANNVSGATVAMLLNNTSTGESWSDTLTTDSEGNAIYSLKNAPLGCYETIIDSVSADGYEWDGVTPANSYCKTSSSSHPSNR